MAYKMEMITFCDFFELDKNRDAFRVTNSIDKFYKYTEEDSMVCLNNLGIRIFIQRIF